MTERKISTGYTGSLNPSHAWSAMEEGYDPGDPVGYGPTEQEAIDDLIDQLDEPI